MGLFSQCAYIVIPCEMHSRGPSIYAFVNWLLLHVMCTKGTTNIYLHLYMYLLVCVHLDADTVT